MTPLEAYCATVELARRPRRRFRSGQNRLGPLPQNPDASHAACAMSPSRARKLARGPQILAALLAGKNLDEIAREQQLPRKRVEKALRDELQRRWVAPGRRLCAIADRTARTHERQARGEGRGWRSPGDRPPVARRGPARSLPRILEVHASGVPRSRGRARAAAGFDQQGGGARARAAAGTRAMTIRDRKVAARPARPKAKRSAASLDADPSTCSNSSRPQRARVLAALDHKASSRAVSRLGLLGPS